MQTQPTDRMALINLILRAVALALGIGAWVLNILNTVTTETSLLLLSIGLTALALAALNTRGG
jgi:hypothetical protein